MLLAGCPAKSRGRPADTTETKAVDRGSPPQLVTADSIRLAYTLSGKGPVSVLLVHMLGRTREDWAGFQERLAKEGFTVLSFDLRGHGESRQNGESAAAYESFTNDDWRACTLDLSAAAAMLRKLRPGAPLLLVGASIGANLSLVYAASDRAVKGVALLSPGKVYRGVDALSAVRGYGNRPLFVAASNEDIYAFYSSEEIAGRTPGVSFQQLENAGHGTAMLKTAPGLMDSLFSFLVRAGSVGDSS